MARIDMAINSVRQGRVNNRWLVLLKEKQAERYLPIYVGSLQADVIKRELLKTDPPYPSKYELSLLGIDTASSELVSVIVNRFKNNVFYAKLVLCRHDKYYEVDCPLAKAIGLAVSEEVPILAEEDVLKKAGVGAQPRPKVTSYSNKVTNHPKS